MTDRRTDDYIAANRDLWNVWTGVHERSDFYDLEGFRRGGVRLRDYEMDEIGPVEGLSLLHLQCHFGLDSLSWARLGAQVTGADFSSEAVALARALAAELGIQARFVESDIYDLPNGLEGEFDIVYTSRGVLGWLPDIRGWAEVAAHFVRPGGVFYVTEVHPVWQAFEYDGVEPGKMWLRFPYWEHSEPLSLKVVGSYADRSADVGDLTEYGWNHSLGEIVTSLIGAGLRIEFLHEFPFLEWPADALVEGHDGRFRLPGELDGRLPLFFSLKASKPG
jgi:SAM-dependent methyltransferase